ncbi:MAG: ferrous iron transport protein A [candidate division Zixibacteria bacterium]|nr:ferrous iron transport protein A [candidate division Zixibacteria bacterium]
MPLTDLVTGERGEIVRITSDNRLRLRLREMGFVPGTKVEVIRWAPFADPIEYRLKGYFISLRRDEAKDIIVHKLDGRCRRKRFRFGWRRRHKKD